MAKTFRQEVDYPNRKDDVHKRNNHQKKPPPGFTYYFQKDDNVIDRNQAGPAGFPGFGVNFPVGNKH